MKGAKQMTDNMLKVKNIIRNEKGNAIVLSITVSIILMIIMITTIIMLRQQTNLVSGSRRKSEALSIAEAGLDAAIWQLERKQTLPFVDSLYNFSGSNTQGTYAVEVQKINESQYVVTSTGTAKNLPSDKVRSVEQDVYYVNLSSSVATFSDTNGGGTVTGSVKVIGPFYTNGNLSLSGSAEADSLDGTNGNPFLVRGNLYVDGSATIGKTSPMAVFVKGTMSRSNGNPLPAGTVKNFVSNQVPEVTLPEIVQSQYLSAAEANDNAVYTGNLTLDTSDVSFNHFNYDKDTSPDATLTVDGVIYINGSLTITKATNYSHASGNKATIFVNGPIRIEKELKASADYPDDSILALINPNTTTTDDVYVAVSSGDTNPPMVQSYIYSAGQLRIKYKVKIVGSVIANSLFLDTVPDLEVPLGSSNYPYLFPGKDLAFLTTSNWREVEP